MYNFSFSCLHSDSCLFQFVVLHGLSYSGWLSLSAHNAIFFVRHIHTQSLTLLPYTSHLLVKLKADLLHNRLAIYEIALDVFLEALYIHEGFIFFLETVSVTPMFSHSLTTLAVTEIEFVYCKI